MRIFYACFVIAAFAIAGLCAGCESVLSPEMTPERVVGNFLGDVGLENFEAAAEWVAPESVDQMESWHRKLFFPEHATPPTDEDETKLDRFLNHFYRITLMESTDTEARLHLVFAATDAIIGFPSIADDPMLPNSAAFTVMLVRSPEGEGEDAATTDWRILSMESITESR